MFNQQAKKILSWIGVGCSVSALVVSLCPAAILFAGLIAYALDPSGWYSDDTVAFIVYAFLFIFCLAFALILGGLSAYYLLVASKKRSS